MNLKEIEAILTKLLATVQIRLAMDESQESYLGMDERRGPKEVGYDTYIAPCMKVILEVIKAYDISAFATFKLDGTMCCTSVVAKEDDYDLKHALNVIKTGDVPVVLPFGLTKAQLAELGQGDDPGIMEKVRASGNWLTAKLTDLDCPDALNVDISFGQGQIAAHRGPWRAAFACLQLYERGLYNPPGEALAVALLTGQPLPTRPISEAPTESECRNL